MAYIDDKELGMLEELVNRILDTYSNDVTDEKTAFILVVKQAQRIQNYRAAREAERQKYLLDDSYPHVGVQKVSL